MKARVGDQPAIQRAGGGQASLIVELPQQFGDPPVGRIGHPVPSSGWHLKGGKELVIAHQDLVEPPSFNDLLESQTIRDGFSVTAVDQVAKLKHVKSALALPGSAQDADIGQQCAEAMHVAVDISDNDPHKVRRKGLQERAHHRRSS
jgi:hypothetical protein